MVESMSATAERIRQYELEYGTERVEEFIDAVLAIQEHVDPSLNRMNRPRGNEKSASDNVKKKNPQKKHRL